MGRAAAALLRGGVQEPAAVAALAHPTASVVGIVGTGDAGQNGPDPDHHRGIVLGAFAERHYRAGDVGVYLALVGLVVAEGTFQAAGGTLCGLVGAALHPDVRIRVAEQTVPTVCVLGGRALGVLVLCHLAGGTGGADTVCCLIAGPLPARGLGVGVGFRRAGCTVLASDVEVLADRVLAIGAVGTIGADGVYVAVTNLGDGLGVVEAAFLALDALCVHYAVLEGADLVVVHEKVILVAGTVVAHRQVARIRGDPAVCGGVGVVVDLVPRADPVHVVEVLVGQPHRLDLGPRQDEQRCAEVADEDGAYGVAELVLVTEHGAALVEGIGRLQVAREDRLLVGVDVELRADDEDVVVEAGTGLQLDCHGVGLAIERELEDLGDYHVDSVQIIAEAVDRAAPLGEQEELLVVGRGGGLDGIVQDLFCFPDDVLVADTGTVFEHVVADWVADGP
eukprot:765506-Hanusia_phi.AAC.6